MCSTTVRGGSQGYSGLSPKLPRETVRRAVKVISRHMRERTIEKTVHTYIHTYIHTCNHGFPLNTTFSCSLARFSHSQILVQLLLPVQEIKLHSLPEALNFHYIN